MFYIKLNIKKPNIFNVNNELLFKYIYIYIKCE